MNSKTLSLSNNAVTLVYKHHRYSLESENVTILKGLLRDPVIASAKAPFALDDYATTKRRDVESVDDDSDENEEIVRVYIKAEHVATVKQQIRSLGYQLAEEYDYKTDRSSPPLSHFHLKPHTHIRSYQERALSHMLGSGRAQSGIIMLPCGAGKTLTGITAAHTIGKSVLVLAPNTTSVYQWRDQFLHWTELLPDQITLLTTHEKKTMPHHPCVLITTYQMLSFGGERASDTQQIMAAIHQHPWGLLLLDEVHVVPASKYRVAVQSIPAHCRLGLTATLVREDGLIDDLAHLVGPVLYSANWMGLTAQGYLANVKCVEVQCPLTERFRTEFEKKTANQLQRHQRLQQLLCVLNPIKLQTVEYLVDFHECRGDKIIIFSDCIFSLEYYAKRLKRPFLYGATREWERQTVLSTFRQDNNDIQTICLSQVGDVAIDLPKANVIIQVSSNYGSQRQEAQRLGRILRPKTSSSGELASSCLNAYFYSLVTPGTVEAVFSRKRQQFLVDQGYEFQVVENLSDQVAREGYPLLHAEDEFELLQSLLRETNNF